MNYLSSISFRLVLTVVITAAVAFFTLGLITNNRLHKGLDEQGNALSHISESLLVERFHGEAHLARDQLDKLSQEVEKVTVSAALRQNTSKAVLSGNDVAVNEALKFSVKNSQVDYMIALDDKGNILGTSFPTNLFEVKDALKNDKFADKIPSIIIDNSRSKPVSHFSLYELSPDLVKSFGLNVKFNYGYVSIVPVFDDFGVF
jgi:hypothetical protein